MISYRLGSRPLKVFLCRLDEIDYSYMFSERNDYDNYRYFRQNSPLHWSEHKKWCEEQASDPTKSMFRIHQYTGKKKDEHGVEGHFSARIGTVGLTSIDMVNRRAEFSIVLFRGFKGYGLGTDSLISILGHGFLDLGLNVIYGEVFQDNSYLEKLYNLGFTPEGIRRDFYYRNGQFIDACLVSITRDEFDNLYSLERISSLPGDLEEAGKPTLVRSDKKSPG